MIANITSRICCLSNKRTHFTYAYATLLVSDKRVGKGCVIYCKEPVTCISIRSIERNQRISKSVHFIREPINLRYFESNKKHVNKITRNEFFPVLGNGMRTALRSTYQCAAFRTGYGKQLDGRQNRTFKADACMSTCHQQMRTRSSYAIKTEGATHIVKATTHVMRHWCRITIATRACGRLT